MSACKYLKQYFQRDAKSLLSDFKLMKPSPEKTFSGSLVYRKVISDNLSVFISLITLSNKDTVWLEVSWSREGYIEHFNANMLSDKSLDEIKESGVSSQFSLDEGVIRVKSLKNTPERRILDGHDLPMIIGKINLDKKLEKINDVSQQLLDELRELALPYLDLLIEYKSKY